MWVILRIIALALALGAIWIMYNDEEITTKKKNICVGIAFLGILIFLISMVMRW